MFNIYKIILYKLLLIDKENKEWECNFIPKEILITSYINRLNEIIYLLKI